MLLKSALEDQRQLMSIESPLKNDNEFISPQKVFSFSKYLSFCLYFLVMYEKGLIRKIRLISKSMAPQPA